MLFQGIGRSWTRTGVRTAIDSRAAMQRLSKCEGWMLPRPGHGRVLLLGRDKTQIADSRMLREGHQKIPDQDEIESGRLAEPEKYSNNSPHPLPGSIRPA